MSYWADNVVRHLKAAGVPALLEISAVAAHDGLPEANVAQVVAGLYGSDPMLWDIAEVCEWVSYHQATLIAVVNDKTNNYNWNRAALFALIEAAVPRPAPFTADLVQAAMVGFKTDRPALYRIVDPESVELVQPYLASKKRAERLGAAEWFKAHTIPASADVIRAAARKEKDDQVKAAMLLALEALDEPLEEFLGPEALLSDATTALADLGRWRRAARPYDAQRLGVGWTATGRR